MKVDLIQYSLLLFYYHHLHQRNRRRRRRRRMILYEEYEGLKFKCLVFFRCQLDF